MDGALVQLDPQELIHRIAEGEFLRDIAREVGIDKRRLSEKLRQHPEYQTAKETGFDIQIEEAHAAIKEARDATDIARAREMFRAAAWRAEREFPGRWGPKSHVVIESIGDLGDRLRRAEDRRRSKEIDVTPTSVSLPSQAPDSQDK